ncbi:hypothetical protein BaRGS_00011826, partial [Batillaria attramentaria]
MRIKLLTGILQSADDNTHIDNFKLHCTHGSQFDFTVSTLDMDNRVFTSALSKVTGKRLLFRPFTSESYLQLVMREADDKRKEEDKALRVNDAFIKDGELKFGLDGEDSCMEKKMDCNPDLREGKQLKEIYGTPPSHLLGLPLEEIDPGIREKTFVVISRWGKKKRYVFFCIYFLEMMIKMTARGLIMEKFTYLRDPWNWLDLLVVLSADYHVEHAETYRHTLHLSLLYTLGLRTIVNAMMRALLMLFEVTLLTIFSMMVFSMFSMEAYEGTLRQKCVRDPATLPRPRNVHFSNFYATVLRDEANWEKDANGNYKLCGNATRAGRCSEGYVCQPNVGENPDFGYTNFDSFGWAMLMSFQLMTLDFWENCYFKILQTSGVCSVFFFVLTVFFGSFYMLNLMLAVVSITYEEEELERETLAKQKKKVTLYDVAILTASRMMALTQNKPEGESCKTTNARTAVRKWINFKSQHTDHCAAHYFAQFATDKRTPYQVQKNVLTAVRKWRALTLSRRSARQLGSKPYRSWMATLPTPAGIPLCTGANAAFQSTKKRGGSPGKGTSEDGDWNVNAFWDKSDADQRDGPSHRPPSLVVVDTQSDTRPHQNGRRNKMVYEYSEDSEKDATRGWMQSAKRVNAVPWNNLGGSESIDSSHAPEEEVRLAWYKKTRMLVTDPLFSIFINFSIIVNTICMSLEHDGMPQSFEDMLKISSYAALKQLAFGVKNYFTRAWNIFDFSIVIMSGINVLFDQLRSSENTDNLPGFLVFRAFRLLRVLKLAQVWPAMNTLLTIISHALGAVGNLTVILGVILYTFAIIGLQLFHSRYNSATFPDGVPRWNFLDFWHSFMMVFRVLCGEWIEPLWDCLRIQNLGGDESLKSPDLPFESTARVELLKKRTRKLCFCWPGFRHKLSQVDTVKIHKPDTEGLPATDFQRELEVLKKRDESTENDQTAAGDAVKESKHEDTSTKRTWVIGEVSPEERLRELEAGPPNCFCPFCYHGTVFRIVENDFFDTFILMLILVSSISLVFEDYYLIDDPIRGMIIHRMNVVFCAVFAVEMVMRWLASGFYKYFTSVWTIIDFLVVFVSLLNVLSEFIHVGEQDPAVMGERLHGFRTFRALRPLRAISRIQSMKIVVNSLMRSIPSILNVFLVNMIFWLIFSVMGVQSFSGTFWKCIDADGNKVPPSVIANNLLALFQVATFEGWMEIMEDAVDSTEKDRQPEFEHSLHYYIYFVSFIICGSFFSLNLVVGVIIDNFNVLKKKYEGSYLDAFLTENQRNYYNTVKKMSKRRPQKTVKRPKWYAQQMFYELALSNRFELMLMGVVFLNLCIMASEYYNMSCYRRQILDVANVAFTTFFLLEALTKIIGLRTAYFTMPWHLYDFFVALISLLCKNLDYMILAPTFLRLIRIFRIGRVLRLIKVAKGLRKLVFALVISLPACLNVMALLLLCMFIYAIFGMLLFSQVKLTGALTETLNFRTFTSSLLLLLSLATAAGWNEVLAPLMIRPP